MALLQSSVCWSEANVLYGNPVIINEFDFEKEKKKFFVLTSKVWGDFWHDFR